MSGQQTEMKWKGYKVIKAISGKWSSEEAQLEWSKKEKINLSEVKGWCYDWNENVALERRLTFMYI